MIVDEGEWIAKETYEGSMVPTLADRNGWLLVTTTPRGRRGWVYEEYQRAIHNEPGYAALRRPSTDNERVRAYVAFRRDKMSPLAFRQEFGAEFTEDESDPFGNWPACIAGELEEPKPGVEYRAGIDLAKYRDWTVLVITRLEGDVRRIVFMARFHRLDWPEQVARLARMVMPYGNAEAVVDQGEVGDAVISMMRVAGMRVDGMRITDGNAGPEGKAKSKAQKERQKQKGRTIGRTALLDHLAAEISQARVKCPVALDRGVLGEEMRSFMVDLDSRGRTHYETRGEFDDCVFAFALSLQAVPDRKAGTVVVGKVERVVDPLDVF